MEAQNTSKPVRLSYSRLSTFEQCPQKFDYLYVTESVKDSGSDATRYGNRVHESLEYYAKTGDPAAITAETKNYIGMVDRIRNSEGDKYYEYQMAIDNNCQPCGWMSDEAYIRSIADVLVVDEDRAFCGDWKTGKVRDNPMQLQLFSCMIMFHFPEVQTVKTSFIWLQHDAFTSATYHRRHLELMWTNLSQRFLAVQDAVDLGVFVAKPSPLCGWCAAKEICPYAKRSRR